MSLEGGYDTERRRGGHRANNLLQRNRDLLSLLLLSKGTVLPLNNGDNFLYCIGELNQKTNAILNSDGEIVYTFPGKYKILFATKGIIAEEKGGKRGAIKIEKYGNIIRLHDNIYDEITTENQEIITSFSKKDKKPLTQDQILAENANIYELESCHGKFQIKKDNVGYTVYFEDNKIFRGILGYKIIDPWNGIIAVINKKGKWGFIKIEGQNNVNLKTDYCYENIGNPNLNLIPVSQNNEKFLLSLYSFKRHKKRL